MVLVPDSGIGTLSQAQVREGRKRLVRCFRAVVPCVDLRSSAVLTTDHDFFVSRRWRLCLFSIQWGRVGAKGSNLYRACAQAFLVSFDLRGRHRFPLVKRLARSAARERRRGVRPGWKKAGVAGHGTFWHRRRYGGAHYHKAKTTRAVALRKLTRVRVVKVS